jgi:predicted nucleic acid-binding protein
MDAKEETEARALLDCFLWAEIDKPTRNEAVLIRRARNKPLRLPDALIAASSITLKAVVLSNDPHLRDYQWPGYTAQPCGLPKDTR